MKVKELPISQVFVKNQTLRIPFFQRAYVWGEENWKKFYEDLAEIAYTLSRGRKPEEYLLGFVIFKQSNLNPTCFDVIDGQQRLSTFVIFMKALFDVIGVDGMFADMFMNKRLDGSVHPILKPNRNDEAYYNAIIKLEYPHLPSNIANSNMGKAYQYFFDRITRSKNGDDKQFAFKPENLHDVVNAFVKLVCIELDDRNNEQKTFETINNTGIKLTTGDLLKNYLYGEDDIEKYEATWRRVFECGDRSSYWEDKITKGRFETNHIDDFLYMYLLIKIFKPDVRQNLNSDDIKRFRKQDAVFGKFKDLIQKARLDIDVIIDEIAEYGEKYIETFKDDVLKYPIQSHQGINRLVALMYMTDSWTMTPYILFILNNQPNSNERTKIFGYLESYLVRRMVCKSKNNNYSDLFSENLIGRQITTLDAFKAYVNDDDRGTLRMPSDDEILTAMQTADQKRNAPTLLYLIECRINSKFSKDEDPNGFVDLSAEPIMPDKDSESWKGETDQRETLVKTLGNFILVREKLSSSQRAKGWLEKRGILDQKSKGLTISAITRNGLTVFNDDTIIGRNKRLAKIVIDYWPID